MSILGSLIVELRAETASFIAGLTGASKTAKTVGREIEESFSSLGSVATAALAPFGEFGSFLGETLEGVGRSAQVAIGALGKMGSGVAPLAVGLGAVAGAMAAITTGAVGLAIHTAMAEAELGEMSKRTGVSTQTLAGLGISAREVGVPLEAVGKSLGFLNVNMVKAAIAPAGTATAFSRLGISVKDASGHLRDTGDVFTDVVGKIASLPAPEQGYFTKMLLGKGAQELLPVLDQGKEKLQENIDLAKKLGLGDPQQVAAAEKFKETVGIIQVEFEAMAVHLTKDLLPALQYLATRIKEAFADGSAQKFISVIAWIAKETIVLGDELFHVFEQIGIVFEAIGGTIIAVFNGVGSVIEATARAAVGDFTGAWGALKAGAGGFKDVWTDVSGAMKKSFADQNAFKNAVFAPGKTLPEVVPGSRSHADLTAGKEDTTLDRIRERIKALGDEAAGWALIASAGTQAEQLIQEAIKKGNAELGKLKEEAAKDKTGRSLPFVNQNEGLIKTAEAMNVFGAAVKPVTADLDKQSLKMSEQTKIALQMAAAYSQGGAAIANSVVGAKFAEQAAKLDVLVKAHELAVATFGKESPATKLLEQSINQLTQSLNASSDASRTLASAQLSEELAKQANALVVMKPYVDNLNSAYFKSEDAIRAARVELELYKWEQDQLGKGIIVTQNQITQKRTILAEADREAYQSSLIQSAAQYDLNRLYDEQIVKLERVREVMQQNGSDTLLIDARLQSAEQQLIKQWDDAAFAVGSFSQKSHAFFNEIILDGQNAGKKISEAFLSAYDSLTGALAKLATGQKANFKQIFQGLAEQVTKAEIQKGIGSLTQALGLGKIPGLGAKADGSEANPFYVVLKSGAGGIPGLGGGGGETLFGGLAGLFSGGNRPSPGQISGWAGGPSLVPTTTSTLPDFLGGFADGGVIPRGKWGIAGESGPEVVNGPATVTPMGKLGKSHQTSITNNFPVMKDYDMFRRSGPQIMAHQHRQMSIAYGRS